MPTDRPPRFVNVRTPEGGRFVHRARKLRRKQGFLYEVVCRRVSRFHAYTETKDTLDCPHCERRLANA